MDVEDSSIEVIKLLLESPAGKAFFIKYLQDNMRIVNRTSEYSSSLNIRSEIQFCGEHICEISHDLHVKLS